jgi:hypothetical protein
LRHPDLLFSLNITFQVMAITDMSPTHQDAVPSHLKGRDDECRIYPAGAHNPNGSQVGRVLKA